MRLYATEIHAYRTEAESAESMKLYELLMFALYRLKPYLSFILHDGTVTEELITFVSIICRVYTSLIYTERAVTRRAPRVNALIDRQPREARAAR